MSFLSGDLEHFPGRCEHCDVAAGPHMHGMPGTDITLYDPEALRADEARVRDRFWPKLRRVLARVPFVEDLLTAWYCARDPATPGYVRAILMAALAYFVLPADVIPDIVAAVGFTDDASALLAAIAAVKGHIRPRHRKRARAATRRLAEGDNPGG